MYDVETIRGDFPILAREVNGKPLVYLDNGASAQKPKVVIDAVTRAYEHEYANVHRGLHHLSNLATEKYEAVLAIIARFLGVRDENEIVLNSGSTEGINLVAHAWARTFLREGDEIMLSAHIGLEQLRPDSRAAIISWARPSIRAVSVLGRGWIQVASRPSPPG